MTFWEVKTPQGEVIDIPRNPSVTTIGDCVRFLIVEQQFGERTRLMYMGRMQNNDRRMDEFPPGALMIVGKREAKNTRAAEANYIPQPTAYPGAPSFNSGIAGAQGHHHRQQQQNFHHQPSSAVQQPPVGAYNNQQQGGQRQQPNMVPQTRPHHHNSSSPQPQQQQQQPSSRFQYGNNNRQPSQQQQPATTRVPLQSATPPAGSPTTSTQRQQQQQQQHSAAAGAGAASPTAANKEEWTLYIHIPSNGGSHTVSMLEDSTLADLTGACLSLDSTLELPAGQQVLKFAFFGKILAGLPTKQLREFGIGNKAVLYAATGQYTNTDALKLHIIGQDFQNVRDKLNQIQDDSSVEAMLVKKQMNENLTKLLIKLDELMEVEGDMRTERRRLVKECNGLIDSLGVSSTPM